MTALLIILGVIMIIGGAVCLLTPVATTFGVMYLFIILLFVAGIMFLVRGIAYRSAWDIIVAILALLAGAFIAFSPNMAFVTETIILYIVACWLIIRGIFGVVEAFSARRIIGGGMFALSLIVSLLVIIVGIYSFIHPMFFAGFLGILVSCFFIIEGIDLIVAACVGKDIKNMSK